jgi:hypothetical protein
MRAAIKPRSTYLYIKRIIQVGAGPQSAGGAAAGRGQGAGSAGVGVAHAAGGITSPRNTIGTGAGPTSVPPGQHAMQVPL